MEEAAPHPSSSPAPAAANAAWLPSAAELQDVFDRAPAYTVGIEDEVMLLDPETLQLAPVASELLERFDGDHRFKLELPASQLEIISPESADVRAVGAGLLEARRAAVARAEGFVRFASCGVHPFSPGIGELNRLPRYQHTLEEYARVASRQLVCALQVHVSVGDAARALAIYNSARSYLPLLAALSANAPFYEGRDTGLASVRPKISELLPRQGIPPVFESWETYAAAFRWGNVAGAFPEPRSWWWELRLHPRFGTLEFRVPDAQPSVGEAIAVAALTQALVCWLGERHNGGERLERAETWKIAENRWSACRHGVGGTMADLRTGARRATSDCLHELIDEIAPTAERLGASEPLERARALVEINGAIAQRRVSSKNGTRGVVGWLAERFLDGLSG